MSFATLTDDDLLAIFGELQLSPLLCLVPFMCRRWNSLFLTATRARQVLILHDASMSIASLNFDGTFPYEFLLVKENGSQYRFPLETRHPAILRVKQGHTASKSGHLPFHPLADHLAGGLFPSLCRVYICMQATTGTLAVIAQILAVCAARLTTLHLVYRAADLVFLPSTREKTVAALNSLLGAINGSTTLRHLHFSLELNAAFPSRDQFERVPLRVHLPVLSHLQSLYFHTENFISQNDTNLPFSELRRHVLPNGGSTLKKVSISNCATLGELNKVEPHLARCFRELNILETIDMVSLPLFVTLCSRFTSLRQLTVCCTVPMINLAQALAPLRHLLHLHLTYRGSQLSAHDAGQLVQQCPLFSVKSLVLSHKLSSHGQFARLGLVAIFPALQMIFLTGTSSYCRDCGYHKWINVAFDTRRFGYCAREGANSCLRQFAHLRVVMTPKRIDWNRWATSKEQSILHPDFPTANSNTCPCGCRL